MCTANDATPFLNFIPQYLHIDVKTLSFFGDDDEDDDNENHFLAILGR